LDVSGVDVVGLDPKKGGGYSLGGPVAAGGKGNKDKRRAVWAGGR